VKVQVRRSKLTAIAGILRAAETFKKAVGRRQKAVGSYSCVLLVPTAFCLLSAAFRKLKKFPR
jgi:hypothetical protein